MNARLFLNKQSTMAIVAAETLKSFKECSVFYNHKILLEFGGVQRKVINVTRNLMLDFNSVAKDHISKF